MEVSRIALGNGRPNWRTNPISGSYPPKVKPDRRTTQPGAPTTVSTVQFDPDTRLPLAGTILVREYKGRKLQVRVLESGFEFEGEVYRSLSAVAKKITGSHCNGYLFFHLKREA